MTKKRPICLLAGLSVLLLPHVSSSVDDERETLITNSIGMKLRLVTAGSFTMGNDDGGPFGQEKPAHEVSFTYDFYIGVHEVTQGQYEAVMGENPSHVRGPRLPVEGLTYADAEAFCRELSEREGVTYRIPLESEWEYACRAETTSDYYWGDDEDRADEYGWHAGNSGGTPHPVGQKKPNGWGLYDMVGNVQEYTDGGYGLYTAESQTNPEGFPKPWGTLDCALRGGSYDLPRALMRSSFRHGTVKAAKERRESFGFRVLREAARSPSG